MLLETLLSSKSRATLLGLFFVNPKNRYYLRQIEALTHLPLYTVQREVARLASCNLLTKEIEGNRTYYRANQGSPIFHELKSMVMKTVGLQVILKGVVESMAIKVAFIYGSYAEGRERPASDIDLMVIGDVTSKKLVSALSKSQAFSRREVNPMVISPKEFKDRLTRQDHFLTEVINGPKIFIVGNEHELKQLVKRR